MRCRATAFHGRELIAEATVKIDNPVDRAGIPRIDEAALAKFYDANAGVTTVGDGSIRLEYFFD